MIEQIKSVRAKLEVDMLGDWEFPPERNIYLRETETRDVIAAFGSLPGRRVR